MNIVELKQDEVNVISGGGAAENWATGFGMVGAMLATFFTEKRSARSGATFKETIEPLFTLRYAAASFLCIGFTMAGSLIGNICGQVVVGMFGGGKKYKD